MCGGGGGKNSVSVYKSPLICHVREFGLDFNNISTTPVLKLIYLNKHLTLFMCLSNAQNYIKYFICIILLNFHTPL